MKQFTINIHLDSGDEINAKAVANDVNDAVDRILATKQAAEFVGDHQIDGVKVIEVRDVPATRTDGFLLQASEMPGYWIITDTVNNLVCRFREGKFNDTKKITDISDNPISDPLKLATALREMGDYLYLTHPELIF